MTPLNEAASIRSTKIWAFSPSNYLYALGHIYFIFDIRIPSYSGLNTRIRSVNLILSWYFTYYSYALLDEVAAGFTWVPGNTIIGKKVLTIFLNDFSSLSAKSYIHYIRV